MPEPFEVLQGEEHEKLRRWRSEFQQDFKTHMVWWNQKREWDQFYDGDQLSEAEKKVLRARNQPEVVINMVKPRVDGIIGDFLGRRVMMRARDRGTADFEKAKFVTEALRYLGDQNRFDEQEAKVAEDLLVGGVGWYKVSLEFDFLEPEIRINYRNHNDVVVDRKARRRDLLDAKRLYETIWVEVEDLLELYPEHETFIREAATKGHESKITDQGLSTKGDDYAVSQNISPDTGIDFEVFVDKDRQRVRLINVWERVPKRVEFVFHPDIEGTVQEITDLGASEKAAVKENFKGAQFFTRMQWQLNSGIFICNKVLEDREDVRPHDSEGKFPFARAIGHFERGETALPYGLVKQYIDPQKEFNKRRSKLLHKSNVNRIIAEEGAFHHNDIERMRQEAAKPDGVIIRRPGKELQIDNDKPDQVDLMLLQQTMVEIDASGVSREFLGQQDKVLSGVAISLRQSEGQKMLRPFFAGLRSARKDIFTIALEEMQQFWTSEKLIKITDDPEAGEVVLNQRFADPVTGEIIILNNLRLGKYDINIDEDLETPNQRQEQFSAIVELGRVALQAGQPFPIDLAIKASSLPNKQEWLERIKQQEQQRMQLLQAQLLQAGAAQDGQDVTPT